MFAVGVLPHTIILNRGGVGNGEKDGQQANDEDGNHAEHL